MLSDLERAMLWMLRVEGLLPVKTEYRFHPKRKWRFDIAYPEHHLAIELEGGIYTGGRHVTGTGFAGDLEKMNQATLRGWRVLRFTREMVESGEAVSLVRMALRRVAGDLPMPDDLSVPDVEC
jgi:very-short-patch-repair endonuclease